MTSVVPFGPEYAHTFVPNTFFRYALVQSGLDLTDLITHRMNIDNFEDGFAAMISGEAGKVVMDWG